MTGRSADVKPDVVHTMTDWWDDPRLVRHVRTPVLRTLRCLGRRQHRRAFRFGSSLSSGRGVGAVSGIPAEANATTMTKGPHKPVKMRPADWSELSNPWGPHVFARMRPGGERRTYPGICYGQMAVSGRRVFAIRGRNIVHSRPTDEIGAAMGLPENIACNLHAMEEHLEMIYTHQPGQEFVVVLENADVVASLAFWVSVFHAVGQGYARPVDQGAWFDRPAMAFHAVMECESDDGLALLCRTIWRATGESVPVPQLGSSPFVRSDP